VGHHQVETRIFEKTYTLQCGLYIKSGGTRSRFTVVGEVLSYICIRDVESTLVTTLYVTSSVSSLTCGLESSSEVVLSVELEDVGRSVCSWVGLIGSGGIY
jgi:hypothetical protein